VDIRKGDVIIIGGGVIGLSAAYYAAMAGAEVIVLEKGEIGCGCSSGNAGLIGRSYLEPLPSPGVIRESAREIFDPEGFFGIKPRLDIGFLSWIIGFLRSSNKKHFAFAVDTFSRLNAEAARAHMELAELGGGRYDFKKSGLLLIFGSNHRFHQAHKRQERATACGVICRVLSREEVLEQEPAVGEHAVGGIHYSEDASLDPRLFLQWIGGEAKAYGARIISGAEVYGFKTSRNQVKTVLTTKGDYRSEQVVVACGSWLSQVCGQLGRKIPVEGGRGISLTFPVTEERVRQPLLLDESHIAITPFTTSLRLTGVLELAGLDLTLNVRRMRGVHRAASRYVPMLQELKPIEIWRGLRPCIPDGLPVLGQLDPWENVLVAGGHDGRGVSLGPITGKYVTRLLNGESMGDLGKRLSPKRLQSFSFLH